jgi:hypothetical protein
MSALQCKGAALLNFHVPTGHGGASRLQTTPALLYVRHHALQQLLNALPDFRSWAYGCATSVVQHQYLDKLNLQAYLGQPGHVR